jgi:hypothetical protein
MRLCTLLTLITLVTPSLTFAGTQIVPRVTSEQAAQFTRARLDDGYALLLGPSNPTATTITERDCRKLYQQRVTLMRSRLDHRKPFWDEPRHVGAVFVGALWTPAFYYLPYRALTEVTAEARAATVVSELDALRAASASARCFER